MISQKLKFLMGKLENGQILCNYALVTEECLSGLKERS